MDNEQIELLCSVIHQIGIGDPLAIRIIDMLSTRGIKLEFIGGGISWTRSNDGFSGKPI